jgi:hypothetical protein
VEKPKASEMGESATLGLFIKTRQQEKSGAGVQKNMIYY